MRANEENKTKLMQNKTRLLLLSLIVAVFIAIAGKCTFQFIKAIPCMHHPTMDQGERCAHIFKTQEQDSLAWMSTFGNNTSANSIYYIKNKYKFHVWELGQFKNVDIASIRFIQTNIAPELKAENAAGYDDALLIVRNDVCMTMGKELNVMYGSSSELQQDSIGKNFIFATGLMNEIGFANNKGEVQKLVTFTRHPTACKLAFIKKRNTFFIVLITASYETPIPSDIFSKLNVN